MNDLTGLLIVAVSFLIVALASRQIGGAFTRIKLPLISGFLACGVLAGPHVLELIPVGGPRQLLFVDQICLAFIAFAAGGELRIEELRSRFRSIAWITSGLVVVTFVAGSTAVFLLAESIPFMRDLSTSGRVAVAILAGAILVARSPSSAIALIKELRAKGRYTQTTLGVTIVMDVVVIIVFAINTAIADALFTGLGLNLRFALTVVLSLAASLASGLLLGRGMAATLSSRLPSWLKAVLVVGAGWGVFAGSNWCAEACHAYLPIPVHLEPLLICMIGSFYITNYSKYRADLARMLHDLGPAIFIVFFTLTGASLDLGVLATTWKIALVLFIVRIVAIAVGSYIGGSLAGEPATNNRIAWMAFITQAGIGLGLAREAADEFSQCGTSFATVMIAVIVLNQLVGPPLYKWAIQIMGEAHPKSAPHVFDGVRDAVIFGLEDQAITLAKQLESHGWNARIASRMAMQIEDVTIEEAEADIRPIGDLTLETLRELEADKAEALVLMLSDDENYEICELAHEHFGTPDVVVRLHDRTNFDKFHDLGALIVDPRNAVVGLLESFVRSPDAASLMMGMQEGQDIIGVELRCDEHDGSAIRELGLPLDVHILSVRRDGHMLVSGGYTQLAKGDFITLAGSTESLSQVELIFEDCRAPLKITSFLKK